MTKFIFFLLFSCNIFSQDFDTRIDSIKTELIEDGKRYNVDMKPYITKIREIQFINIRETVLGKYGNGVIKINTLYEFDRKLLKIVFYHEVGHLIGLQHMCNTCPFIMSANNDLDYRRLTNEQWEYQLSVFFGLITQQTKIITVKIQKNGIK